MSVRELVFYVFVYIIPSFALLSMASIIVSKNYKRIENRLVAILVSLYSILFIFEFVRHLLPISYSPIIVHLVILNIGILIHAVAFHFYIHLTKLHNRIKIPFYPLIFYIPVIVIVTFKILNKNYSGNMSFIQSGIWYAPIKGPYFYLMVAVSSLLLLILFIILINGMKHTKSTTKYALIRLLAVGTFIALIMNIFISVKNTGTFMPPYPSLLIGILLAVFIALLMNRYELLPSIVKKYQTMFNLSPVSIIVLNEEWDVLEFNEQAGKVFSLYGSGHSNLLDIVQSNFNREKMSKLIVFLKEKKEVHDYSISFQELNSKSMLYYAVDASVVLVEDKVLFYTIWRNVTEELKKERLIKQMAYYDSLTELHNRAYFVAEVKERLIKPSIVSKKESALVLIDLNRFKLINDTYGHAVGDKVLQHTAKILTESVRANDLVGRIGGDEFVIFLNDFPVEESVFGWKDRLYQAFVQNPFKSDLITIDIELSIGIAYFPMDGNDFEKLFQTADSKMYEDKWLTRSEV